MADTITLFKTGVPATCTVGGTEDWVTADFKFVVTPDIANAKYTVKVYARMSTPYNMQWNGDAVLRVTCNNVSDSKAVTLQMYSTTGSTTDYDGPASFSFKATSDLTLDFDVDLDLTSTTGTNGKPGITHTTDNGNLTHFKFQNYEIDVSGMPLTSVPSISNLTNTNKYDNNAGISASMNSISLSWNSTGDDIVTSYYRIGLNTEWIKCSNKTSVTISGLTAGTSYTIYIYSENSAGRSSILNITVKTLDKLPIINVTLSNKKLESLVFKWTSDKDLEIFQYKLNNGSWRNGGNGTSGTVTLNELTPNTSYNLSFRGIATIADDSLTSLVSEMITSTADIAHISSIDDCIFGQGIIVDIDAPTIEGLTYNLKLKVWTEGNSNTPTFNLDNISPGAYTFNPTQSQLDEMYRCFTNKNEIPIHFLLYTHGETKDWEDTTQDKSLRLTGIAKTAHIGVNDAPKRAQAFVGVNNVPKRAVVWIGDENNIPRRCI